MHCEISVKCCLSLSVRSCYYLSVTVLTSSTIHYQHVFYLIPSPSRLCCPSGALLQSTHITTLPNHQQQLKSLPLPSIHLLSRLTRICLEYCPLHASSQINSAKTSCFLYRQGLVQAISVTALLFLKSLHPPQMVWNRMCCFLAGTISPHASLNSSLGWESPSYPLATISLRIWVGLVKIMAMLIMMGSLNCIQACKTVGWPPNMCAYCMLVQRLTWLSKSTDSSLCLAVCHRKPQKLFPR